MLNVCLQATLSTISVNPEFPWGPQSKEGDNLLFCQNLTKLHENEENWSDRPIYIVLCRCTTTVDGEIIKLLELIQMSEQMKRS